MALRRVASLWEKSAPYPHWKSYAPAFREYSAALLNEPHRQLAAGKTIGEWYGEHRRELEKDPYMREKN